MKLKITTAPWRVNGSLIIGKPIKHAHQGEHKVKMCHVAHVDCSEHGDYYQYDRKRSDVHRNVIAAAPDLLIEAYELRAFLAGQPDFDERKQRNLAAIAKAEGRAP